jgi:hypothetical protein
METPNNMRQSNVAKAWHVGLVVDNDDTLRLQRIKVTIPNVFPEKTPLTELPWVGPILKSSFGATATASTVSVPVIGARVVIEFQGDDTNHGLYHGYITHPDHLTMMDALLLADYPHAYGFFDPLGNVLSINLKTGNVTFKHNKKNRSGHTTINIDQEGNINITASADLTATVAGSTSIATKGSTSVTTEGNTAVTTKGTTKVTSGGGTTIDTTGNTTISTSGSASITSGGATSVTAGGAVSVRGSSISLN